MVRSRKRITRKDIRQPDQFISLTGKVFAFLQTHRNRIILGIAIILVLSLSVAGWRLYRSRQDRAQAFTTALEAFHDGNFDGALDQLERVDQYWSPKYRGLAALYRAQSYINLEQPKEAIPPLESLLTLVSKNSFLRQLALTNLGYAHEMLNQCKEAIGFYDEASKLDGPQKEQAHLAKARCTAATGGLTEAIEIYRDYKSNYPNSVREVEIDLRIQDLEQKMKGNSGG